MKEKKEKKKKEDKKEDKKNHPDIGVIDTVEKVPNKLVDDTIKIDFNNPPNKEKDDAIQEQETTEPMLQDATESNKEGEETEVGLQEVGSSDGDVEEVTTIQEVTNEEPEKEFVPTTPTTEPVVLPENVEHLVQFMEDTGGTVEDYVRLNADYSNVDPGTLLHEYYKQTKPHLNKEEINFMMDDKFRYDEEMDEEREVRKKQLALKEEVAEARNFLAGLKDKYYNEIKLRPGITQEQQKATEFFNKHNKEQEIAKEHHKAFKQSTTDFFSDDFKGFDFNVGEKKFRYGIKNPTDVATAQSDIATFIKKFLNEDGSVKDYTGYHKAIYAARNSDTIAQHFYEQGKADAIKDVMVKSKNVNKEARQTAPDDHLYLSGLRIKAISGVDSSKLRIKKK